MGTLKDHQWQCVLGELSFRFVRSSGPGGQKVNKTSSKVELRWLFTETQAFNERDFARLQNKLSSQLTSEGYIVVQAENFRSREMNKSAAVGRLRELLQKSLFVPKKRKKPNPSRAARQKRLNLKKQNSDRKKDRKKVDY